MMGKIFMILLVLLGAAMAIPSTRAKITDAGTPIMDKFKAKMVPRRLEVMSDQLNVRLERGQGLPSSWDGWLRRDFSGAPEDPWGNLYYLESNRRGFTVGSMGPDGVQGNADDITVERREGR
jgi:hypothetical protein